MIGSIEKGIDRLFVCFWGKLGTNSFGDKTNELIEDLANDVIEIWSELIDDCSPMWSMIGSIEKGID